MRRNFLGGSDKEVAAAAVVVVVAAVTNMKNKFLSSFPRLRFPF